MFVIFHCKASASDRRAYSVAKVAQHAARTTAGRDDSGLVDGPYTVHPHAMDADGRRVEPLGARREIPHPTFAAARDGGGVEKEQIGPGVWDQTAPVADAIGGRDVAGDALDGFGQPKIAALAHPVAEQVQPEARITEKRKMGARV